MFSIREMKAADLDAMLDLRQKWLSQSVDGYTVSQRERDWFAAYPGNPQAFAFLALEDGQCLGYLLCSWHGHPTMSGASAEIDEIHVASDNRRRGIGRQLVDTAREMLLDRVSDLTTIRAGADRHDVSRRAFWAALGFAQDVIEFVDYLD